MFWWNTKLAHLCLCHSKPCCAVQRCGSPFMPSDDINFHVTQSLEILLGESHVVINLSFYLVINQCNQESLITNCTNTTCCLSWQVLESCSLSPALMGTHELLSAIQKGCHLTAFGSLPKSEKITLEWDTYVDEVVRISFCICIQRTSLNWLPFT